MASGSRLDRVVGTTVVLNRSMNSGTLRLVDAPHGVDAKRDLQVVAAEHRFVAGEVLGVGVRRDADVGDVQQPACVRATSVRAARRRSAPGRTTAPCVR